MVPEMIKRLERSSLGKKYNKKVQGISLGAVGKVTYCPQENSAVKHKWRPPPRDFLRSCLVWLGCRDPGACGQAAKDDSGRALSQA